eukprot:gb/GFBE01049018.1/.p1 GENE.gb/GFBE01049018.1/~~gb/GFBE01049018.1/.p1  ORF type:complete len:109 (+),score=15.27 gb/GFBE01049018.1/:1-327(+)
MELDFILQLFNALLLCWLSTDWSSADAKLSLRLRDLLRSWRFRTLVSVWACLNSTVLLAACIRWQHQPEQAPELHQRANSTQPGSQPGVIGLTILNLHQARFLAYQLD